MQQKRFEGKTVLITGSGSGIGKATAQAFGREGAAVMLNGRDAAKLEITCALLLDQGCRAAYCVADVTNYADCQRLVRETLDRFGRLDALVANAGMTMRAGFEQLNPGVFQQVVASNLLGPAYAAHAALPALKASGGNILFIGSLAGLIGLPSASAYSAGKMALTALTQSLRTELSEAGVHVGIVYVGFTQNDAGKRVYDAQGNLVPVAERPGGMQQSQEAVAKAIVRSAYRRKKRTVLTTIGKILDLLNSLSPSLVEWALKWSQKKMQNMYK